jgi:hypothetical protein
MPTVTVPALVLAADVLCEQQCDVIRHCVAGSLRIHSHGTSTACMVR